MYEPSLEEMEAFGYLDINGNNIYFESVDSFLVNAEREDFATKPYLQLLGGAEIAYNTPEFFWYNVPDSYRFSNKEVYYKTEDCINTHHEVIIKSMGCGCKSRDDRQRCGAGRRFEEVYDFTTMREAKSFMFRLVLCWLKQESERENNG